VNPRGYRYGRSRGVIWIDHVSGRRLQPCQITSERSCPCSTSDFFLPSPAAIGWIYSTMPRVLYAIDIPKPTSILMFQCPECLIVWSWFEGTMCQMGCGSSKEDLMYDHFGPEIGNLQPTFTLPTGYMFTTWKARNPQRISRRIQVESSWKPVVLPDGSSISLLHLIIDFVLNFYKFLLICIPLS
jgi:hypothetical protein